MPRATRTSFICAALVFAIPGIRTLQGADLKTAPATIMETVTPAQARAGDVITVHGQSLDANHLKAVFLTDRTNQVEVQILIQDEGYVTFKMPAVDPGKWHIAIKLANEMFLEEPVFVIALPDKG
jgi:hypothetical protein